MIAPSSIAVRLLSRPVEVSIRDCVHYCGFRYGRGEFNPYERYAIGLASGTPLPEVRAAFVDFLTHYRPATLGEVLGLRLQRDYPSWQLPWASRFSRSHSIWTESVSDVVDVMTHFCARGIPSSLVEKEFAWHENAFQRMAHDGYRPMRFFPARVIALQGGSRPAYLVADGNHRISALSSLGVESLRAVRFVGSTVWRSRAASWPLVRRGVMPLEDALKIFDVYHNGNHAPSRVASPAPIVRS